MKKERYKALMEDKAKLSKNEIKEGWHFCWEFDGLLIGPGWGELSVCSCLHKEHPVYKTCPEEFKAIDMTELPF